MLIYDLIVVGGGPSGIFSSIFAAQGGLKVLLLEKNSSIGKKLLVAGQGKCNLTNNATTKEFLLKYGDNGKFLKPSLCFFTPKNLLQWFEENGLPLTLVEGTNKYFPHTFSSKDVVNLLEKKCIKSGVTIKTNSPVTSIELDKKSRVSENKILENTNLENLDLESLDLKEDIFTVICGKERYKSKSLIIATGGASYPGTGTTGDGYAFGKSLGHKPLEARPCLTPVFVDNYNFTELSGISFQNLQIKLVREGREIQKTQGDILFTHHNLSGPGVIDFSRYIRKDDILKINFIHIEKNLFNEKILDFINSKGKFPLKTFFSQNSNFNLPERFLKRFMELSEIQLDKKSSELTKIEREKILTLSEYSFRVTRLGDFNIAMATTGGISLDEISSKTMESKIVPNLYFTGEVLDIDGDTGGYNIQAAISTGVLAASSICKKYKKSN